MAVKPDWLRVKAPQWERVGAVKAIPLGQTAGQQVLLRLAALVPVAVERASSLNDDELGAATPALAIASSLHETQYTRLFRS